MGSWFYSWDTENWLILAVNGSVTVQLNYDVFGRRTQKIMGTSTTQYDFVGLDDQLRRSNSTTRQVYTLTGGMIGQMVSVRNNGVDYFYHYDPIGNVLMITNAQGNVIANYTQEGFGNVIASTGSANNNYHLTTREQDPDLGLYYVYARWYDPQIGRWISREPTGQDGPNLYQYADNNPINEFDPDGRCPVVVVVVVVGGVVNGGYDAWKAWQQTHNYWNLPGAFGEGFVSGSVGTIAAVATLAISDNPLAAEAAAGAVGNGVSDLIKQSFAHGLNLNCYNGKELAVSTGLGAVTGPIGKAAGEALAPTVGRLPDIWAPRTFSNYGPNSLRILGQGATSQVVDQGGQAVGENFW